MKTSIMRSALFVPGDRPERFTKALASGADAVIVDFEDAVDEAKKDGARDALQQYLDEHPDVRVWVRVNAPGHSQREADLRFCASHTGVAGIMLPKAESTIEVSEIGDKRLLPLIETARGITQLAEIAACSGVERLSYGALDLAVELGTEAGSPGCERLYDSLRLQLLLHTRLAGLQPPLESVYPSITDESGLRRHADDARQMGFAGVLCIHPTQIAGVHAAFAATSEQLAWAREVTAQAALHEGAFRYAGQMVDAPVLARARRLLDNTQQQEDK